MAGDAPRPRAPADQKATVTATDTSGLRRIASIRPSRTPPGGQQCRHDGPPVRSSRLFARAGVPSAVARTDCGVRVVARGRTGDEHPTTPGESQLYDSRPQGER